MSFDDLPQRPKFHYGRANDYAEFVFRHSRTVAQSGMVQFSGDVAFGPDYYQRVDVYTPKCHATRLPVLLFAHGGSFIGGFKEWCGFMAPALLATPAVLVSVSYRLAPEHVFPAAVEDVAAAVNWAWHNVANFGGDPDRIFVGGHSAGGHLMSLISVDRHWLAPFDLPDDIIKGVLPLSAPLDLDYDMNDRTNEIPLSIRRVFVPNDADVLRASPIAHVTSKAPPHYIAAGENDIAHIAEDVQRYKSKLGALGVPAFAELFAGHDHFDVHMRATDEGHPWIRRAQVFLRTGSPL